MLKNCKKRRYIRTLYDHPYSYQPKQMMLVERIVVETKLHNIH